jgi:lipoate-protein ligase A
LGYFQRYRDREQHDASGGAVCVRRSTGGGAIVHHNELTYSLIIPMAASATKLRQQLYRDAHECIVAMLAVAGVHARPARMVGIDTQDDSAFLCFQRRTDEDLIVSGYKVLGSAQRRARRAVLQHGSLLLKASPLAPELPGILDLTSRSLDPAELQDPLGERLSQLLGYRWQVDELTEDERDRSSQIESERFAAGSWTHRR